MLFIAFLLLLPLVSARSCGDIPEIHNILENAHEPPYPQEYLDFSNKSFTEIHEKAFQNVKNIVTLNIENNHLKSVPAFVFSNLTKLETLSLANNQIDYVEENTFVGLNNLKHLNLTGNQNLTFADGSLFGLPKNVNIYVLDVNITSITPKAFEYSNKNVLKKNGRQINCPQFQEVENKTDTVVISKNFSAKLCMKEGTVLSLETMKKDEKLEDHCEEVNTSPTDFDELDLSDLEISNFEKGWYRLEGSFIKTLNLSRNRIEKITEDMLNDLPDNIKIIELSFNRIRKLVAGVIRTNHIEYFILRNNTVEDIEADTFKNTKLTVLDLCFNELSNLTFVDSLPTTIINLQLDGNSIKSIPEGIFSHLSNLKILTLFSNNIIRLENGTFRGLKSLRTLGLGENELSNITIHDFGYLKKLEDLSLAKNLISTLPKSFFKNLAQLEFCDLSFNKLKEITSEVFSDLPKSLTYLFMKGNEIESVETGSFINGPKSSLDLSDNKITNIKPGTFNLPELERLNLESNFLTDIKFEYFESIQWMTDLKINNNKIKDIEKGAFRNNRSLKYLYLSFNRLKHLENGVLHGLPKSAEVFLDHNNIEVIQSGIFEEYIMSK